MTDTTGKTALILGATGGAGYETAKALAARGWRIRAMHRDPQKVSALLPDAAWVPGDAMRQDWSWETSAGKYADLYTSLAARRANSRENIGETS